MPRSPLLKQRKPLAKKRLVPRRNAGRVQHGRVKERTVEPTLEQQRFHDWLREVGTCQACGGPGKVIHHLLANVPGKVGRRDHWFVVRLDTHCHNGGTYSVHLLGSEEAFKRETGVDLVAIAVANRAAWEKRNV